MGSAAEFLTLRSTYLGDGLFEYRVDLADDVFFTNASVGSLSVSFTNRVEFGATDQNWTSSDSETSHAIWNFDLNSAQTRPYSTSFQVRSSNTTYRTVDAVAFVSYQATPQNLLVSTNFPALAGFAALRAIVPCSPDQADGSSSQLFDQFKLREELTISGLATTPGEVTGISFWWNLESTVQIQSSPDLSDWVVQTNLLGEAGTNEWVFPVSVRTNRLFYRLRLLATGKRPDLIGTHR